MGQVQTDQTVENTSAQSDTVEQVAAAELNQVWTNVIDNAIDAMDEGGELILKTRLNDIWVEIEIVDDGSGIPEEILSHVFEPFFTTKDVGVGTGLGLGIAMRIVETHQGHIEVRSKPGRTGSRSVSRMGRVEPPDHETTGPPDPWRPRWLLPHAPRDLQNPVDILFVVVGVEREP